MEKPDMKDWDESNLQTVMLEKRKQQKPPENPPFRKNGSILEEIRRKVDELARIGQVETVRKEILALVQSLDDHPQQLLPDDERDYLAHAKVR